MGKCSFTGNRSMKIKGSKVFLVSLIRNEADICAAFLSRAVVLFDHIIAIDHQSTDGTRSILERFANEYGKIAIIDYNYRGYYQAEISTRVAHHAFREGADWVFFLDADEFIDVDTRGSFEVMLATFPHDVMSLSWANLIPTKYGSFTYFDMSQEFRLGEHASAYGKIGLKASFVELHPRFVMEQGNHAVFGSPGEPPASMLDCSRLLHVPIRSQDRLRYKLDAGVRSYQAMTVRHPGHGFHWFQLSDRLAQGDVASSWLNGVISHYSEPLDNIHPVDPVKENWDVKYIPGLCQSASEPQARSLAETIEADSRQSWTEPATVQGGMVRADLEGNRIVLRPLPIGSDGVQYSELFDSLSEADQEVSISIDYSCIAVAISRAFDPIVTIVPSTWTGHVPLLFALFSLIRPRRYVEIGTGRGTRFFAACQAAEHLKVSTECIAIDSWIDDDEHVGGGDVFEAFTKELNSRCPANAYFIRSGFSQALQCFDERSIDLFHIDGAPTYEAVKANFESWLPKMSAYGTVIFRNTNYHQDAFGVWRLWNELKLNYPHFELPHCSGIGVLYVGSKPSPFAELLRELQQSDGLGAITISLFAKLGATFRTVQLEKDALSTASRRVELLELDAALAHRLLASLSWRLTLPLRYAADLVRRGRRSILKVVRSLLLPAAEDR
jgi:Glycosyl transferase family 2/Methyltransferase domain